MKKLKYIYVLLMALLLGFIPFSCSDDGIEEKEGEESVEKYSGEPITTTVKVCVVAPDVSVDVDTRAGGDKANIEYEQPENGGRFQNIVVVVTDNSNKVYAIHCNKWYNNSNPTSAGMKQYEVIFPDLKINATSGKVYALGNVSTDVYETISGYTVSGTTALSTTYMPEVYNLIKTATISADEADLHKLSFTPKKGNFKVGGQPVTTTCSGMPVNAMATATIQKGATIFEVHMKRVCARLQVTFRNFTGQYIDYDSGESKDNNVYVDNFVLKKVLLNSSKYFYNSSATLTAGSVDFNILTALGGSNNHKINKIENGKEITVSMYVFENKKGNTSGAYTYDLKVDRGKSLGNRAGNLEDGNVYVMWNDNLDSNNADFANFQNYCLGADDNKVKVVPMNDPDRIPFGTSGYGNRVFWHYTGEKLESCKVNLSDDVCILTGKYIRSFSPNTMQNQEYPVNLIQGKNSAQSFTETSDEFHGVTRKRLRYYDGWAGDYFLQISANKLYSRYYFLNGIGSTEAFYPWVFFAKYIMKTGVAFKGNGSNITQIERNHSYELDFSVMPNYDTKQELLVKCVRKQNEISWEETQK